MAGYDASIMAKLWRRSAPNYIRSTSSTGARGRRPICDQIQASVRPTDRPTDERITPTTTPPINCHISCWVDPLYSNNWPTSWILYLLFTNKVKKVKVAHTRLPSVGFRSWSRLLAVSLQVTWVINPAVRCHYFPPGLRGLPPISLFGEQRHNGCEQFAKDCYPTASRLRFEPGPSAPESTTLTTRLPSHRLT